MEIKKVVPRTEEMKGYSASQSIDVRKGYNPQAGIQARNNTPLGEGYNAQQMIQTANNPQQATNSQSTISKKSDDK